MPLDLCKQDLDYRKLRSHGQGAILSRDRLSPEASFYHHRAIRPWLLCYMYQQKNSTVGTTQEAWSQKMIIMTYLRNAEPNQEERPQRSIQSSEEEGPTKDSHELLATPGRSDHRRLHSTINIRWNRDVLYSHYTRICLSVKDSLQYRRSQETTARHRSGIQMASLTGSW